MSRPFGMTPTAYRQYEKARKKAGIPDRKRARPNRITQTIGSAPASEGFHAKDGTVFEEGERFDYCAAFDASIDGLKEKEIREWLHQLARYGFVAWYRYRGSFKTNRHIHGIYVNLPMKPVLARQVRDFLNDRDGLAGHGPEPFYTAPRELDAMLREAFLKANP